MAYGMPMKKYVSEEILQDLYGLAIKRKSRNTWNFVTDILMLNRKFRVTRTIQGIDSDAEREKDDLVRKKWFKRYSELHGKNQSLNSLIALQKHNLKRTERKNN